MLAAEVHRRLISDCNECQERALWRWRFAWFDESGWQDMRAMYDLEASDGISGPSWQEFHVVYSWLAVCGAFWIHGARILPKPAHFGYIVAICCHGGAFFLSEAPLGMHQVKILPRLNDKEGFRRISCHCRPAENASRGKSCHCRPAENASRRNLAIVDQWRTHRGEIMPSLSTLRCALAEYSGSHRRTLRDLP